jgi:tetratricopeptide (TPR) repeat protein
MMLRVLGCCAALALGSVAACAPSYGEAYLTSMAAGHRAYHAGRYQEAARAYDEAARKAKRVKDRDEARFLQARTYERAEQWRDAATAYRKLAADSPTGPRTARAEFELADLEIEHGASARGWQMLHEATRRNPRHGLARHAITRMAQHAAEVGGEPAGLAWLQTASATFRGTDLEQLIAYEIALSLERQGRLPEARDAFVACARSRPYPIGGLTDDALWRAAEIEVELGHHARAIALLRELLGSRESPSHTVGSYERPRFSQAQLRIAEITRDGLRDPARARVEFHKVFTDHPTSIARDDALWAEAKLARQAGDTEATCRLVRLLASDLPESRYARCVRELCPTAQPPAPKKGTPPGRAECPEYIKEDLAAAK